MKHGAERTAAILRRGNGWTRLSALVMGAGCLRHGQIVKGLLYLGFEVLYALFFFGFGWPYLRLFPTLGTTAQSRVWDEAAQIYRRVPGDNSMLILLFSVVTLASLALLFAVWRLNLKSAWLLEQKAARHEPVPRFREEVRTLMDERFHVTLLSLPMLTLVLFTALPIAFMILIAFTDFGGEVVHPVLASWSPPAAGPAVHLDGPDQRDRRVPWQRGQNPHLLWDSRLDAGVGGACHLYQLHSGDAFGSGHQPPGGQAQKAVAHLLCHRHCGAAVRQPPADLAGAWLD